MTETALVRLFDHAGMFPPASKPLEEALADAAGFPSALARPGIVNAEMVLAFRDWPRLDAAALDAAGFAPGRPCRVALVGLGVGELAATVAAVGRHQASPLGPRAPVVSVEPHFEGSASALPVGDLASCAPAASLFVEPRWSAHQWGSGILALCQILRDAGAGLKFRCAGPSAVDAATLARIVVAAAGTGIPVKATQGLHRPVAGDGHAHGFLALLAALRLRQRHGASFPHVAACLGEGDAAAFDLRDGIAWRSWSVTADELEALAPFAIGSCSLEEPDRWLVEALGLPVTA